ncbi:hypothetical protein [Dorea formicigenerans]|uniref:hypothetical protein n=1 Tax=Dorea formicigenerans TaxID=39486 RepID=UPI001A9A32DB|nr:hypothetical protein [Dorea formicigenerans]
MLYLHIILDGSFVDEMGYRNPGKACYRNPDMAYHKKYLISNYLAWNQAVSYSLWNFLMSDNGNFAFSIFLS